MELQSKYLRANISHGSFIMVWNSMTSNEDGLLKIIDGKMDKFKYLHILKSILNQATRKMNIRQSFHFYLEDDYKHKSKIVQEWLLYDCPKVINTPPHSPELIAIENLLDFT